MEVRRRDPDSEEPPSPPEPDPIAGLHLALMGIDGAGKSTIAVELATSLRADGHEVEIVNFKRAMAAGDPATASVLTHVAFGALKAQYAGASPADPDPGNTLDALVAREDAGAEFAEVEKSLRAVPVGRNAPRPLLSAAVLEIVGGIWVHTYVESRLRAGVVVINDSFGYKHVLKNVLLAQRLSPPGSPEHSAAQRVLETARSVYGGLLRPAHGYWIDTEPRLARRWRETTGEITTPFESYGLAGENGDTSYLDMQEDCRPAFQKAAEEWGWRRVTLGDRPRDENITGAVRQIQQDAFRHSGSRR